MLIKNIRHKIKYHNINCAKNLYSSKPIANIKEFEYVKPSPLFSKTLLTAESPLPITNLSRDTLHPRKLWTSEFDPRLHKLQLFLPQEIDTPEGKRKDMLFTYRKLLKEARDFFDPRARTYLTMEIKSEFRRYRNENKFTPERINDRRRQARKVARKLYKANQLDENSVMSVLRYTYGRTGPLRWELLTPILPPMNIVTRTYKPGYPLHIELDPTLQILLRSQKLSKVGDPDPNLKSIRRQYNSTRAKYKNQLEKVLPTLPNFIVKELELKADVNNLTRGWEHGDEFGLFNSYGIYISSRFNRENTDFDDSTPLEVKKESEPKTLRVKQFNPLQQPINTKNEVSSLTNRYFNQLPKQVDYSYVRKISRFYKKLLSEIPILDESGKVFYSKHCVLSLIKGKGPIIEDFPEKKFNRRTIIKPLNIEAILDDNTVKK